MQFKKLALLSLFPLLFSCEPVNRYLKIEDEAPIEECVEAVIQAHTGISADLTPTSPE